MSSDSNASSQVFPRQTAVLLHQGERFVDLAKSWDRKIPHAIPLLTIAVFAMVPFLQALITGEIINSGDVRTEYFPQFMETRNQVRAGLLPLWNPNGFIGRPFLPYANAVPAFYPVTQILFWLPDPVVAFTLDWPIHLFIAGLSMYAYLRVLELGRGRALAGALIYMLASATLHRIAHPSHFRPLALIPGILLFVELGFRRNLLFFIVAGVVVGLQMLSGHPQPIVYSAMLVVAYGLWRAGENLLKERRLRPMWYGLAGLMLAFALGLGLGAVQMLPMWEMLSFSDRAGPVGLDFFGSSAIDPRNLLQVVMPLAYGEPEAGTFWGSRWDNAMIYIGILPLLLSPFAYLGRHRRLAIFFGLVAVLSIVAALGPATPFIRILYSLPGINAFRAPSRFLHLYVLAVAVLAAMGLEELSARIDSRMTRIISRSVWVVTSIGLVLLTLLALMQESINRWLQTAFNDLYAGRGPLVAFMSPDNPERQAYHLKQLENAPQTILFSAGLLVVLLILASGFFGLRNRISSARFSGLAVGIIAIDLVFFGIRAGPLSTLPRSYFEDAPATAQLISKDDDTFRILSWDGSVFRNGSSPLSEEIFKVGEERIIWWNGDGVPDAYYFEEREILPPYIPSLFGVRSFNTYGALRIKQWVEVRQLFDETPSRNQIGNRQLLDLLNIKYVVSSTPIHDAELSLIYGGDIKVYENTSVLPRAFLVSNWRFVPNDALALRAIAQREFEPAKEAILVGNAPAVEGTGIQGVGHVTPSLIEPGREVYEVQVPEPSMLIISNWNYPGWRVRVNGESSPVLMANYFLIGIQLEAGHSTVEVEYQPVSFGVGAALSILSALIAVTLGVVGWRKFGWSLSKKGRVGQDQPADIRSGFDANS